tara:strand:- start:511 stop:780 length:270 start_codon:yes stop_codon:yes gene_type:complete
MVMRPYTAVVIREGKTVVINIDAPLEKEKARKYLRKMFPSDQVMALIPGVHAGYSYTFNSYNSQSEEIKASTAKNVDLFDMSYITKNNA